MFPGAEKRMSGAFKATQTLAKGTVLGIVTATGKLAAYDDAAVDGLAVAVGILEFPITVDANGKIFLGSETAAANVRLTPLNEAPYFISGTFDTADLTGYDAAALVDFKGRALRSTLIYIP